jgi:Protein of unknown function (DUF2630)
MSANDVANTERHIERLSAERIALFARAGAGAHVSETDRSRLKAIERELDERFLELRRLRAVRDAGRFDGESPVSRSPLTARPRDQR